MLLKSIEAKLGEIGVPVENLMKAIILAKGLAILLMATQSIPSTSTR